MVRHSIMAAKASGGGKSSHLGSQEAGQSRNNKVATPRSASLTASSSQTPPSTVPPSQQPTPIVNHLRIKPFIRPEPVGSNGERKPWLISRCLPLGHLNILLSVFRLFLVHVAVYSYPDWQCVSKALGFVICTPFLCTLCIMPFQIHFISWLCTAWSWYHVLGVCLPWVMFHHVPV